MVVKEQIHQKLERLLLPLSLEVIDFSSSHAGHNPAAKDGGTHIEVRIVSEAFEGLNTLARHRKIYAALADELKQGVHALVIKAFTPQEQPESVPS